jgi:TPR repeat protein
MRRLFLSLILLAATGAFALGQGTLTELRTRATAGDKVSQFLIGRAYYFGTDGLPRDEAVAATWFQKAAEQGQVNAQTFLGYMYEEGRGGLAKDDAKAADWYRKAADLGESNAQRNLGLMYFDGRGGFPKDEKQALLWLRRAADQGDPSACNKVGMMYEKGQGDLSQDTVQALYWYRKAADKGYAPAQNNAAIILLMTHSPELRNPRAALDYASKASASAPYNLNYLATLAEAYFVDEQFDKAIITLQQVINLTPAAQRAEYQARLSRYQAASELSRQTQKPAAKLELK